MDSFIFDVRNMIRGPFVRCSACGNDTMGLIHVRPTHFGRRCKSCLSSESVALPELRKKILYLDQFVISNMMKALDPDAPSRKKIEPRWLEMFSLLNRVVNLQLIVCPDSSAHRDESAVDPASAKLRRLYELLSHGVTFESFEIIRDRQIFAVFMAWLDGMEAAGSGEAAGVTRGALHGWTDPISVSVDLGIDFSHDLRRIRDEKGETLARVHEVWKGSPRSFEEQYAAEIRGWGQGDIAAWADYCRKVDALASGEIVEGYARPVLSGQVRRVRAMMEGMRDRGIPPSDRDGKLADFYESGEIENVPSIRLAAMLLASLAHEAPGRNPPNRGTIVDFNVASCLLPYCDAIFLDRGTAALLRNEPLRTEINRYDCKIFSPSNFDEFISYLLEIQEQANPEHLDVVKAVYGEEAGEPFLNLFTYERDLEAPPEE